MLRLVWAFGRHAEVVGLFLRELGQLHADAIQVQAGDFFIDLLGQTIDADFVCGAFGPEVQLREALVGEAVAHHEARMAGGTAEVHEALT